MVGTVWALCGEDLFSQYVDTFTKWKVEAKKNSSRYTIAKLFLNSLYGRFGLNPSLNKHIIAKKSDLDLKYSNLLHELEDKIDLDNFSMCSFNNNKQHIISNVAIASFVTAYARIMMSEFKNKKDLLIYYSDTDSNITNRPLSEELVHNSKLGLMKLESVYSFFISINAKSWIGIKLDGSTVCKLKGSKSKLSLLDFITMLSVDSSLTLNHEKWYKFFNNSTIRIKNTPFTLKSNNPFLTSNGYFYGFIY